VLFDENRIPLEQVAYANEKAIVKDLLATGDDRSIMDGTYGTGRVTPPMSSIDLMEHLGILYSYTDRLLH
jgi:hypothetical protein